MEANDYSKDSIDCHSVHSPAAVGAAAGVVIFAAAVTPVSVHGRYVRSSSVAQSCSSCLYYFELIFTFRCTCLLDCKLMMIMMMVIMDTYTNLRLF